MIVLHLIQSIDKPLLFGDIRIFLLPCNRLCNQERAMAIIECNGTNILGIRLIEQVEFTFYFRIRKLILRDDVIGSAWRSDSPPDSLLPVP